MKQKITLFLLALTPLFSNATVHIVQVSNTGFAPSSFNAVCGDTVNWIWVQGSSSHTSSSTNIPPCATTGFTWNVALHVSNPSFSYVIPCGGVFNYQCNLHVSHTGSFTATCATGIGSDDVMPGIITIYPNPISDKLNIDISLNKKSDITCRIYDMYGKEITSFSRTGIYGDFNESTSFAKFPSGVYFVLITLGEESIIRKIVHQH